jgi:enoyl-CoA hydratase/carnithine racemase
MSNISPTEKILVDIHGHYALITINNAPANTWDEESLAGLATVLERLERQPRISTLILRGQGEKFFSAGADLGQFASGDRGISAAVSEKFGTAFEALATFRGVTIAAVNGYAMGGGLECALACDIRIFEQHAQVALPEAKVGLLPCAGGTQRLAWLVGEGWATRMILCGERIDTATAERIGLAQEVVEQGQSLDAAIRLANQVAQQSPDAIRACKRLMIQGRESTINEGLNAERSEFIELIGRANQLEGTNAFLQKRPPNWQ